MKKIFFCLLLACAMLSTNSCRKALRNVNDYYPNVKTVSAAVQADGTVLVKGEIVSNGASPIQYIGFCCSKNSNPKVSDNQIMTNVNGNTFYAVYSGGFNVDSVYYFRAWAANDYGYTYSNNIIPLDNIIAKPITPPCSITMNTLDFGDGIPRTISSITTPVNSGGIWSFDVVTSAGPTATFSFGSNLTTGIFITNILSPNAGEVTVSFTGTYYGALNSGSNVYVNTIGAGAYDITICNGPWYNSYTYSFNTHFKIPY